MFLKNRLYIGHNFAKQFVPLQPILKKKVYMNMRFIALMLVVPAVIAAKAQSERRMTVDDLFQLVESNSKTLQETKISVEFAQKGIEAAR